jgi:hypothetical protein
MAFRNCLAAMLLLLVAPGVRAAADHKDDGRCLGTLDAAMDVLAYPQNADEFADVLATFRQASAAWVHALDDDPAIDPATRQSITDAARAEHQRWAEKLGKATDEEFGNLQYELVEEANVCLDYAPAAKD